MIFKSSCTTIQHTASDLHFFSKTVGEGVLCIAGLYTCS